MNTRGMLPQRIVIPLANRAPRRTWCGSGRPSWHPAAASRRCPSWRYPRGCPCPRERRVRARRDACSSGSSSSRPTASTCGRSCGSVAARQRASWSSPRRRRRTWSSSAGVADRQVARSQPSCSARPSMRCSGTHPVTSRSSSSGAWPRCTGSWCRCEEDPTRTSRSASAAALGRSFGPRWMRSTSCARPRSVASGTDRACPRHPGPPAGR